MTSNQLTSKGYRLYAMPKSWQEAKDEASRARARGHRATARKSSTAVKGIYNYSVWIKMKP